MSTFLINASNLKAGGGLQVAQSVFGQLSRIKRHQFVIVRSDYVNDDNIEYGDNTAVVNYNLKHSLKSILLGRDSFLDNVVAEKRVDAVLTIFGPSLWRPRCPHLCGFARAQLLLDSGFKVQASRLKKFKTRLTYRMWDWAFKHSSILFYTENKYISEILEKHYKNVKVYTVSNYYNQVFDTPEKWKRSITLPPFDGVTCLSVSSPSSHKNFGIIEGVIRYLRKTHPGFKVRFVMTFTPDKWPMAEDVRDSLLYVGKTDVSECPYLYEQADIMFMPTLMECFTATYPEAMRMEVPIVTTDLEFARGLCGDAACYYSAIDAKAAAEAIYKVATDKEYTARLVENGKKQLLTYDNYEERADKLINILEEIAK